MGFMASTDPVQVTARFSTKRSKGTMAVSCGKPAARSSDPRRHERRRSQSAVEHARSLVAATDAWLQHLRRPAPSSVRAYKVAIRKWFLPTLGDRSLDRVISTDVEAAMTRMRAAGLSDKSVLRHGYGTAIAPKASRCARC